YANFTGQPASQILTNGTIINYNLGSETEGAEFEITAHPFKHMGDALGGFELAFSGTYQHGTYNAGGPGITGSEVARQPDFQFRLTPSYTLDTSIGVAKLFATTTYVDSRWGDQFDTQFLPSYMTEDIGASLMMDNGLEVRFTGTNITNTLAITEGNSRVVGSGTVGGVFLGRPLFGATYEGSVALHF
ncbi:MAG TPA: TonB-dependent receptor, partial [Magnetospirillaceae bacterium]|nr:TonB-dependent receptor [Magnetospirillaceae bacterium]